MRKNILILACLGILMILPNLTLADCAHVGGYNSYVVIGNTVILYAWGTPFASFDVKCNIQSTSQVQIGTSPVCDGDNVMVDGSKCTILDVRSSNVRF